jgi:hypothetical protein
MENPVNQEHGPEPLDMPENSDEASLRQHMSFADFYFSDDNPDKFLPPAGTSTSIGAAAVVSALSSIPSVLGINQISSPDKQQEFAQKVSEMAHEPDFIDDLSARIGSPGEEETEEAFVRRAKTILRELLRSRFRSY